MERTQERPVVPVDVPREQEARGPEAYHAPVLLEEVLALMAPQPNENFVDATFGLGGHARAILERTKPRGKLLGVDLDEESLQFVVQTIMPQLPATMQKRMTLKKGNFRYLKDIVRESKMRTVSGVLFDLGMSSWQIEHSGKGFSFQRDEFMDMRFSKDETHLRAFEIVNLYSPDRLELMFRTLGGERQSRRIARAIVERRKEKPFTTGKELGDFIAGISPRRGKLHPATKVFQALRIEVNQELENLAEGLDGAFAALSEGGRMAVISFHELEDRTVKMYFRGLVVQQKAVFITKKAVQAARGEVLKNPRARSARLRVVKKLTA